MEESYFNGENSDFEDDVIETDFEDQFEEEVDSKEIGTFGVPLEEEEPKEEEVGMEIPTEFKEEVAQLFPEANVVYPDGLEEKDIVPQEEY